MKIAGLCLPLKPQKERIYKKAVRSVSLLRTNSENCESLLKKIRYSNLRKVDFKAIH